MMIKNKSTMNISIMDREFCISCPDEEREEIQLAVAYLDKKIQEVKEEGKVVGSERIAIIAALSITHELLLQRTENSSFDIDQFKRRIGLIQKKLDDVLAKNES